MGFNQFMQLDSAADYTVKHTEQSEGLASINFKRWHLNRGYDGFEVGVLISESLWAPDGRSLALCVSKADTLSERRAHR